MNKNELLVLFDLKENDISDFRVDLKDDCYMVYVTFVPRAKACDKCGSVRFVKNGFSKVTLVSNPINGKTVRIVTTVHNFKCKDCGHKFDDSNPIRFEDWRFTRVAIITIIERLKRYNETYSSVASDYAISPTKIITIFDDFVRIRKKSLPRVLLIDEFYFSRHAEYKYPALLMNFENNVIIDIVESRKHEVLYEYFFKIKQEERDKVEFICTDMSLILRPLLQSLFKNSTLLVDHFHVTKYVNDQLNNTRKRVMRKYVKNKSSMEYRLLKHRYRLLLTAGDQIDLNTFKKDKILGHHATQRAVLDQLLKVDSEIEAAYKAKEEYLAFDHVEKEDMNNCHKEEELRELIKKFRSTNVEESIEVANTLKNWSQEILNSFTWIGTRRISNGPIEGKNNYIKKILGNANGMTNFERARNKIMYSQNKLDSYVSTKAEGEIKKAGKERGKYKKKKKENNKN